MSDRAEERSSGKSAPTRHDPSSVAPAERRDRPRTANGPAPFIVYDPVMVASSGEALAEAGFVAAIKARLLPLVDCLTPNLAEAAALLETPLATSEAEMAAQGAALLALGPRAILMKGGHLAGAEAVDLLVTAGAVRRFAAPRLASPNLHGTGCTLSSAIAAHIVLGADLPEAVAAAKDFVSQAIERGRGVTLGGGPGPLAPLPLRVSPGRPGGQRLARRCAAGAGLLGSLAMNQATKPAAPVTGEGANAPSRAAEPSPMMAQYLEIKAAYPDCLLFYRMGDFYELFFADAEIASRALGIVLTKRGKHEGDDIPMCGVPIERADDYLQRLIAIGHRVAVCEQLEDPAEAKKRGAKSVVRRDVVRLVTPGTITEERLLEPGRANLPARRPARARPARGASPSASPRSTFRPAPSRLSETDEAGLGAGDRSPRAERDRRAAGAVRRSRFRAAHRRDADRHDAAGARSGDAASAARLVQEFYGVETLDGFGALQRAPKSPPRRWRLATSSAPRSRRRRALRRRRAARAARRWRSTRRRAPILN